MTEVLTPTQLRMARAALRLSCKAMGHALKLSGVTISHYERGLSHTISLETAQRITNWCVDHEIYFGPHDGVCVGHNIFTANKEAQDASL